MGYRVVLTKLAISDLRGIYRFIARHDRKRAEEFTRKLKAQYVPLSEFPRLGRVVPDIVDGTARELIYGSYRIVYRIKDEQSLIEILRFWHAARGEPTL